MGEVDPDDKARQRHQQPVEPAAEDEQREAEAEEDEWAVEGFETCTSVELDAGGWEHTASLGGALAERISDQRSPARTLREHSGQSMAVLELRRRRPLCQRGPGRVARAHGWGPRTAWRDVPPASAPG